MRRKVKRSKNIKRAINWKPTLWCLFILNMILGFIFSRITSLHQVRVAGSQDLDKARIIKLVQQSKNAPFLKLKKLQTESQLLENQEIENVKFTANIFGRGVISIQNYLPIAKIKSSNKLYLSSDGTLFHSNLNFKKIPSMILPESLRFNNISFLGSWESNNIAKFCKKMHKMLSTAMLNVELDPRGMLSLYNDNGIKIILGSSSELESKFTKLQNIFNHDPEFMTKMKELNLTTPSHPVYIPAKP